MKNIDVIKLFVSGATKGKTKNLYIDGDRLINYSTVIAKRVGGVFYVNGTKYSHSTSTIQGALKVELQHNYIEIDGSFF